MLSRVMLGDVLRQPLPSPGELIKRKLRGDWGGMPHQQTGWSQAPGVVKHSRLVPGLPRHPARKEDMAGSESQNPSLAWDSEAKTTAIFIQGLVYSPFCMTCKE